MKHFSLIILAAGLTLGVAVSDAQALDKAYLGLLTSGVEAKKQILVTANMKLGPGEAELFWPIYKEYDEEMSRLSQFRREVLQEYRAVGASLSEEMAGAFLLQLLDLDEKEQGIKRKYFEKLEEEVSPKAATRLFLVDSQINLMLQLELTASKIPIVR